GSWLALSEITDKDENGNGAVLSEGGKLVSIDSTGNLVYAEGARVIALVGVEGLAVVQTDKATLVCPLDRAQDVKRVVDELKASGKEFL
ncbi:MAG: mannose-1-phosphate guanylyltransferase, partial [Planctomycetota bacterium]